MMARRAAEAFERGERGASVRYLSVAGRKPLALHELLLGSGFRCSRLLMVGQRTRDGVPLWRVRTGVTPERHAASSEYVYVHNDGGVVRIFPDRGPTVGFDEMTPILPGVVPLPFARKSLLSDGPEGDFGWTNEAAVITAGGQAVPRGPRPGAGIKYSLFQPRESYRLARSVLKEQYIPLLPGPLGSTETRIPALEGRGLVTGLTILPKHDFWKVADGLVRYAREGDPRILVRDRPGGKCLFFAGAAEVAMEAPSRCVGLASLFIQEGYNSLGLDPIGYEASVQHLASFLQAAIPRIGEFTAYDNYSGQDLTHVCHRRIAGVVQAEDPALLAVAE